jgi:hypothetical protein
MKKKVSVFCIWRDAEKHIHRTLKQLEDIESLSEYDFSYFFYENDSTDNTSEILREWIGLRKGFVLSEKLSAPKFSSTPATERMKFLCECRNKCKVLAAENDSDYSLLIDGDIEFSKDNFLLSVEDIENLPRAVMVTPNVRQNIPDLTFSASPDSYYDVYPFRDRHGNDGIYFSDCPSFNREDQMKWRLGMPILCLSAFGGFALLKSDAFNSVSWSSDLHCDHVNMCFDLGLHGHIYCNPRNKVYTTVDLEQINLEVCKTVGKQQKEKYEKYFLF